MRRLLALVLVVSGCARSHVRASADAASDPAPILELPAGYSVWDTVATIDDEVCVAGIRHAPEASPLLPDVDDGDAFVACFTASGSARVAVTACPDGRFGVQSLAANARGDLFALVQDGCTADTGIRVVRLDRTLSLRAQQWITTTGEPGPFARALAAAGGVVVVAGGLRTAGGIGGVDGRQGPFVAVLSSDDLRVLHVEAGPPRDRATPNERVSLVAAREGAALLVGDDLEGGVLEPAGGPFARTMSLPDGVLAPIATPPFEPLHQVLWHPDGRPVVLGRARDSRLGIQLGDALFGVDVGIGGEPHAAFLGDQLLVTNAVPAGAPLAIAGHTFTRERDGGVLVALDPLTLTPAWAIGLAPGHQRFFVEVLPDGTIATIATAPTPDAPDAPGMRLTFHSSGRVPRSAR